MSPPEIELRILEIVDDFGRKPDVRVATFRMPAVPDKGEGVNVNGKNYVVSSRSWSLQEGSFKACILRVRAAG